MTKYYYIREANNIENNPLRTQLEDGGYYECRRVTRGNPVACVAYQRRKDEDMGQGYDLVTYAVSAANTVKGDEFNKKEGRKLAQDRLTNSNKNETYMDKAYCFNVVSETNSNEVLQFILDEVADNGGMPSRVRRAARRWLDGKNF